MSTPKVIGIETEYGVAMRGVAEFNPVVGSSNLVNAYAAVHRPPVRWDFEDEHPDHDARDEPLDVGRAPEIEVGLANVVLTNGARFYVDHAHPEYSTPECLDFFELVNHDAAGMLVLQRAMDAAESQMPDGRQFLVHKNNSDGKGNSYGCHENYLVDRNVEFSQLVKVLLPFFVTRQVICGSGKVGSEHGAPSVDFQISQRADFFEEEVGLETTLKRPIVNTRDESHADPEAFRRLHVIVGDANMSEVATFMKVGMTAIVLEMIEEGFIDKDLSIEAPVPSIRQVSHDPSCRTLLRRMDGTTVTPVQMQWEFFELAKKWSAPRDLDRGRSEVLDRWERILTQLEDDPSQLYRELDWVAKYRILEGFRDRHGAAWDDPRLALIDLQYHDIRPSKGLYFRLVDQGQIETLCSVSDIDTAVVEPPFDTRAFFRGRCIEKFANQIVAANWDSLVFDLGTDPLQRIPMMDPTRGSKAHVGALLDECDTVEELIERIST